VAGLYNLLDSYADALGAAFSLVHHSSKGNHSGKNVTDVGAGAGAQSRAADTHLVLRPHESDSAVVVEAAVRSWAPVSPPLSALGISALDPGPGPGPRQAAPGEAAEAEGRERGAGKTAKPALDSAAARRCTRQA